MGLLTLPILTTLDCNVRENSLESQKIAMNVGYQSDAHLVAPSKYIPDYFSFKYSRVILLDRAVLEDVWELSCDSFLPPGRRLHPNQSQDRAKYQSSHDGQCMGVRRIAQG